MTSTHNKAGDLNNNESHIIINSNKKSDYSTIKDDIKENYISGGTIQQYSTKQLMHKARSSYLCEFSCSFDNVTEERIRENKAARNKLFYTSIFCFIFMLAEFFGGYFAHSLALMSDATHLLSDLGALMISIFTLWLTTLSKTNRLSFGYHRAEILGALFSVFLIWALTAWLVYEAIRRLLNPEEVDGELMFIVACAGIAVNIIMGLILGGSHSHGGGGGHSHGSSSGSHGSHSHGDHGSHGGKHGHSHSKPKQDKHEHSEDDEEEEEDDDDEDLESKSLKQPSKKSKKKKKENINVRSALIHVIGDLVQSVGVLIAASLIWYDRDKFHMADPICTLIFSVIVLLTTRYLVRDAFDVLMESVPRGINVDDIKSKLITLKDVAAVHDLHVWMVSLGKPALSVHLLVKREALLNSVNDLNLTFQNENNNKTNESMYPNISKLNKKRSVQRPICVDGILRKAQKICSEEFGIEHATIQIEWPRSDHKDEQDCPSYCISPNKGKTSHVEDGRVNVELHDHSDNSDIEDNNNNNNND